MWAMLVAAQLAVNTRASAILFGPRAIFCRGSDSVPSVTGFACQSSPSTEGARGGVAPLIGAVKVGTVLVRGGGLPSGLALVLTINAGEFS
jgi:hypothetical protein